MSHQHNRPCCSRTLLASAYCVSNSLLRKCQICYIFCIFYLRKQTTTADQTGSRSCNKNYPCFPCNCHNFTPDLTKKHIAMRIGGQAPSKYRMLTFSSFSHGSTSSQVPGAPMSVLYCTTFPVVHNVHFQKTIQGFLRHKKVISSIDTAVNLFRDSLRLEPDQVLPAKGQLYRNHHLWVKQSPPHLKTNRC